MGATLLNTATHGAVRICTDGNTLTISPFNSKIVENHHGNF
jgi:hypothetical protein